MGGPPDYEPSADLADRVDGALEAFRRGDSTELENLLAAELHVETDGAPPLLEAFHGVAERFGAHVAGLPADAEVHNYRIIREIGRGGMGVVYEAEQREPQRRVAFKVLRSLGTDEHHVRRFRREIQTLAALKHPAIATIYEAGQLDDGRRFFTMELVDGLPLQAYARQRQIPLPQRLELFARICEAVEYAHAQGIIHRDLKPSNIFVDAQGHPRILDFGLARNTKADVLLTITASEAGTFVGTLAYMSPEQARGDSGHITLSTDVYSLGVILYELLTGQPPYPLKNLPPLDVARVICEQRPRRPRTLDGTLPQKLEAIVLKALEKEPADRYGSAQALADDIRRYLSGGPTDARPPGPFHTLRKKLRKHRAALALAGAAVALAAIGTAGAARWSRHVFEQRRVRELAALEEQRTRELALARRDLLLIEIEVEKGEVVSATARAERALEKYAGVPEACLVYAQANLKLPDVRAQRTAIACLETELDRDSARWDCAALLAEIYRRQGNAPHADRLDAQVRQDAPNTAAAWYLRSFATLDPEAAAQYVARALSLGPSQNLIPLVWERRARLGLLTGDLNEALRSAEHLLALGADPYAWGSFRGAILARLGRLVDALQQYDALLQSHGYRCDSLAHRAHVYRRLRNYTAAIEDYTQAVRLASAGASNPVWYRYHRATPLWMLGRTREAADDYRAVRENLGRPCSGDARLYVILRDEGRTADAEQVLRLALKEVTDDWLRKTFECLVGTLATDDLVREGLKAKESNREHWCEAYYYAGEACRLAGKLDRARECFEQCVGTGVRYDLQSFPDPMNEYELAEWRLGQLTGAAGSASPP